MVERQEVTQFNRIEWVDIAKGLGILLVIIGHCVYLGGGIHNWIFSFHMPLFFMLSGFFVREEAIWTTIKKKSKSLLFPYFIFVILGFVFTLLIPGWRANLTLKGIAVDIYMGSPDAINISSVWFLICLFVTILFFECCLRIKKYSFVVIIVIACIGWWFAENRGSIEILPANRLPFNIDVSMIALLFLAIGYYGKNRIYSVVDYVKGSAKMNVFICVVLLFVSFFLSYINRRVNLHGLKFNNFLLYIIESFEGILFIISTSVLFLQWKSVKNILLWFAHNSIKILGAQALYIRIYIYLVEIVCGEKYDLYFLSQGHVILSIIFVVIFSSLSVCVFNTIIQRFTLEKCKLI